MPEVRNHEFLLRFKDVVLDCSLDQTFFDAKSECLFMCKSDAKKGVNFQSDSGAGESVLSPLRAISLRLVDLLLYVTAIPEGLLTVAGGAKEFEINDERVPSKAFNFNKRGKSV